ncbi:hypothetical protein LZL24_19310, partial [Pseudomonas aeruginosa]|nr:hypothetical protein [Pseudomonas aeruginosa]
MSRTPSFAVVLEGGLVQAVVVQDWPRHLPVPPFVVVDYDTEGADDSEITRFAIGQSIAEAICRGDTPTVFESLADALSPRIVLTALGESIADEAPGGVINSVFRAGRELHGRATESVSVK